MDSTFVSGALLDMRTPEQKAKDFQQKEVVAAAAQVQWTEKPQNTWRKFPIFNQDGSGSCVMQTQCKEMGIMRQLTDGVYVHFSVADGYQRRIGRPVTGMGADDARRIAKEGITLEVLSPSQNMSDQQLDAELVEPYKHQVGTVFSVPNYLSLPTADIEAVASTIQATGKGVMIFVFFKIDEWTESPTILHPELAVGDADALRHAITVVDFTLRGNEKCLVIEDSWGTSFGMAGQRVVSETFFKRRNYYAGYLINFQFQQQGPQKPHHFFAVDMQLGDTNDEVKALQDCLKFEGLFPANADSTGYFGPITQKAVQGFQLKHGVVGAGDAGYGRAGPKTRAALNSIYGQ